MPKDIGSENQNSLEPVERRNSPLKQQDIGFVDRILNFFGFGNRKARKLRAETDAVRAATEYVNEESELVKAVNRFENIDKEIEEENKAAERRVVEEQNKLDDARRTAKHKELEDQIEEEKLKADLAEQRRRRKRVEEDESSPAEKSVDEKITELEEELEEKLGKLRERGYTEEDEVWKRVQNRYESKIIDLMTQ